MSNRVRVKICGLRKAEDIAAAVDGGAAYLGFNFFPKSPRSIDIDRAVDLASGVPPGVAKVVLTVDASDAEMDTIVNSVPVDMLQLHGAESPERVVELRQRYGLPVMKVIGIAEAADVAALNIFGAVADQVMVDAKPPPGSPLPGGNGIAFDWRLIANRRWPVPWMLAGGLNADNVAEAIRLTGTRQVDVSSGVESAPGVKDSARIAAFLKAALTS